MQARSSGTAVAQNPDLQPLTQPSALDQLGRNYYELGDVTPEVKTLQQDLNNLGYPVGSALTCSGSTCAGAPGQETDTYGPATYRAVEQFQQANGLTVDGQVGPQTIAAINAQIDAQPAASAPTASAPVSTDNGSPASEATANETAVSGERSPVEFSQTPQLPDDWSAYLAVPPSETVNPEPSNSIPEQNTTQTQTNNFIDMLGNPETLPPSVAARVTNRTKRPSKRTC